MADLDPDRRFIMHFPEENLIESVGSGYGGNALLPKKCHALRLASVQARREGWLAEHMLIVGIESPDGQTDYIAAAFPSACGKTNLAMLRPPAGYEGWKIWTVGDDIAWMHEGEDGRLWAINPERGFFGVIPGTNSKSNPSAFESIQEDTIYTNAAVTADNSPWWEGLEEGEPALDWQGRPYGPDAGRAGGASQLAFYGLDRPLPNLLAQIRRPPGRADLRHRLRRPPLLLGASGARSRRLGPRRAHRRLHGL